MNVGRRLLSFGAFVLLTGCFQDAPVETSGSVLLSSPTFSSGNTQDTYTVSSLSDAIAVSGDCGFLSDTIELSDDDGGTWSTPDPAYSDGDCDDGFTFTLPQAIQKTPSMTDWSSYFPGESSKRILIRGMTLLGASSSSTIILNYDTSASIPSGTLAINSDDTYTLSKSVSLSLSYNAVTTEMYITESSDCSTGGSWQAANSSAPWTHSLGNTNLGVYVKFRAADLVESTCVGDSIVHDDIPPGAAIVSSAADTMDTTPTWTWSSGGGGSGTFKIKMNDSDMSSGATETTLMGFTPGSALGYGSNTLYVQERDAAGNWSSTSSFAVTIHEPAANLVWSVQPAPTIAAGSHLVFSLEIRDAFNNIVTFGPDATADVSIGVNSGPGTLSGAITKQAVNGVVTFSASEALFLNLAGTYTLLAAKVDTSGGGGTGVINTISTSFSVTHATASQLAFDQQPTTTMTDTAMSPDITVRILDGFGNLVTTASNSVALSIASGGSPGLPGTNSVSATSGVASFANFQVAAPGTYTLSATSTGLTAATSSSFTITAAPPPYAWVGGGGNANWSNTANWSTNTVPTLIHTAIFDNAYCVSNCSPALDGNYSVGGISMTTGYSGQITQGSFDLTISTNGLSLDGGAISGPSGAAKLLIHGPVNMTGGMLNMNGGDLELRGSNISLSGGTVNMGISKLVLAGSGVTNFTPGGHSYSDVEIKNTAAGTNNIYLGSALNIYGDLLLNSTATTYLHSSSTYLHGSVSGTSFGGGTTNLTFAGISNQNILGVDAMALPFVYISKTGGTLFLNGTVHLSRDWVYSSGTVDAGTSTLRIGGQYPSSFGAFGMSYNNVIISKSAAASATIAGGLIVNGDLTFNNSAGSNVDGSISVAGDVILQNNSGGTAALTFNGTGDQTVTYFTGVWPSGDIIINKTSGSVELAANTSWNGSGQSVTLTSGTLNLKGNNLVVSDGLTVNSLTKLVKECGVVFGSVTGTGTVIDGREVSLAVNLADATISAEEGLPLEFIVSITPPNCLVTHFDYTTNDGPGDGTGAIAPGDYTATAGTATLGVGVGSYTITVPTQVDALDENDFEYMTLQVTGSSTPGVTVTIDKALDDGEIEDTDGVPEIEFSTLSSSVDEDGVPAPTATVVLSHGSSSTITVDYTVGAGSATDGDDYDLPPVQTLTFSPGETSKLIPITLNEDLIYEGDETIFFTLANPAPGPKVVLGMDISHTVTIAENDAAPYIQFNSSNSTFNEDDGTVTVTVNRVGNSTQDILVDYEAVIGVSADNNDFTLASGTLTFGFGELSKDISIALNDDGDVEGGETFDLHITGISGGPNATAFSALPMVHTVTITDDDILAHHAQFQGSTSSFSETGSTLSIPVELSNGPPATTIVVNYTVSGTAASSLDFTSLSGTITFAAGTSALEYIDVSPTDDIYIESDETIVLELTSATGDPGAALGATTIHTVTLTSDDIVAVEPVYTTNPKWNDYVRNDDNLVDEFHQDDTTCTGAETGYYQSCIHSGEKRKVVVYGHDACTNLEISDNLGVFDWICQDTDAWATFYSTGFKAGRGLRDLIRVDGIDWKDMQVSVSKNAILLSTSNLEPWWSNDVTLLPPSSGGSLTILNLPSTVYTVPTNLQVNGYTVTADRIAVVTINGASLQFTATTTRNCAYYTATSGTQTRAFFCFNSRKFLWFEGLFDGLAATTMKSAIVAVSTTFSRLHNLEIKNLNYNTHDYFAILLGSASRGNLVQDVIVDGSGGALEFELAQYNTIRRLKSARSEKASYFGPVFLDDSHNNRFYDIEINYDAGSGANPGSGIELMNSDQNVFVKTKIANSLNSGGVASVGFYLHSGSSNNIVSQSLAFALGDTGVNLEATSANVFSHGTYANNGYNGVYFASTFGPIADNVFNSLAIHNTDVGVDTNTGNYPATPNRFYNIASSNNAAFPFRDRTTPGIIDIFGYVVSDSPCSTLNSHFNTDCNATRLNTSLAGAFIGGVTSESVNTYSTGVGPFSGITDWLNFENFYRGWGKDLTTVSFATSPSTAHRGPCSTGNCQIADWRVKSGSPIHNRSGIGSAPNTPFNSGSPCPSAVNGSEYITAGTTSFAFLKNAIEVIGDKTGNENGLCESNEKCIYAPNIGAYQGEGDFKAGGTCIFQPSAQVTGVTMYAYPTTSGD